MNKLKYILFFIVLAMISLPAIQKEIELFYVRPLDGDFLVPGKPAITKSAWLSGDFQQQYDRYLEEHIGFRSFLVRLYNQLDFSLFRKANAEGAIVGLNGHLYEYDYVRAYYGYDFVGEEFITKKLNRFKFVQDHLEKQFDVDLVLVFEPGKASFYPEYIPDRYSRQQGHPTNYELYLQKARELDIRMIDLNDYFLAMKTGASYPLFPKYGTHWSIFGMSYAVDSLVNYISNTRNMPMVGHHHDSLTTSLVPRFTDYDVGTTLNLLFQLPGDTLAYPVFIFDEDSTTLRPMVLAVADSYYWNIFNTRLPRHLFANEAFWYFNYKVYPDAFIKDVTVDDLDLKTEIEKQDVIMLMVTERFLYKFDWSFTDRVYALYAPAYLSDPEYDLINTILENSSWFEDVLSKAKRMHMSTGQALQDHARYMFEENHKKEYLLRYGVGHYKNTIRNDDAWSQKVADEARADRVPFEETLTAHADYMFWITYPGLHEKYHRVRHLEDSIRNDKGLFEKAKIVSEHYRFSLDKTILAQAGLMYENEQIAMLELKIRSDSAWMSHINEKAFDRGVAVDTMIRIDAMYLYGQQQNNEEALK